MVNAIGQRLVIGYLATCSIDEGCLVGFLEAFEGIEIVQLAGQRDSRGAAHTNTEIGRRWLKGLGGERDGGGQLGVIGWRVISCTQQLVRNTQQLHSPGQ